MQSNMSTNQIRRGLQEPIFDVLKDDILQYTPVCVSEVLDHLLEQSLPLTNVEKDEQLVATQLPLDQDLAMVTYFHNLNKLQEEFDDDVLNGRISRRSFKSSNRCTPATF